MIAVLSPHLDDAVLSAWTALRGAEPAVVVNVFDGVPPAGTLSGWDRITGATDSSERMRERLEEDRRGLAVAGSASASLGLLEDQYRDGRPQDPAELGDALAAATADAGELWAPAGIGGHGDHVAVRDWALGPAARGRRVRLYADIPYAVRHGWPAWVTDADPDPYFSHDLWWERFMPGDGVVLEAAAHSLSGEEVRLKLRALAEYRTQLAGVDSSPLTLVTHPLVIGHEVSWGVAP